MRLTWAVQPCRRGMAEALCIAVLSVTALNCFKDPVTPMAPSWDVDLTFPVGSRTVTVAEMIDDDSSLVRSGPNNQLAYVTTMKAPPTLVGDRLSMTPADAGSQIELGSFTVEVKPIVAGINVPSIPPGTTGPVASQTLSLPPVATTLLTPADLTLASGLIGLTVRNNLPVELQGLGAVQLLDNSGLPGASFDLAGVIIPPGESRIVYDNLAGRFLGSGLTLAGLNFSTPGSPTPVTMPNDSMLVATLTMSNLRASAAEVSGIPAQRLIDNDRTLLPLNDSTLVREVWVRRGRLHFDFTNRIDLGVRFTFRLEELWRRSSGGFVRFEDSVFLPALGSASYSLDLAGCRLQGDAGQLLSALQLTSSVIIPTAIDRPVSIHDTDKVHVAMTTLAPIVADSIVGIVKPTWLDIQSAVALNSGGLFSKLKAQFNIPSASLALRASLPGGYPADLDIRLSAAAAGGRVVYLDLPEAQRRLPAGGGVISFDGAEVGRFLSQFTGGLPDSLRISGRVLVNPADRSAGGPEAVRAIGSNSALAGEVSLTVPMTVGITRGTYRDTTAFGRSEDGSLVKPGQEQLARVNGARLFIEVENGLPAGVGVTMHLLDGLRQRVLNLPRSGEALQVSSGIVDGQGFTVAPGRTVLTIELDHADVQQYIPAEFVDYEVDLATAGGAPVVFRTTDAVKVRAWTQCSYGVNK